MQHSRSCAGLGDITAFVKFEAYKECIVELAKLKSKGKELVKPKGGVIFIKKSFVSFQHGLDQGCQTYGPRAACGPRTDLMRPARKFFFMLCMRPGNGFNTAREKIFCFCYC